MADGRLAGPAARAQRSACRGRCGALLAGGAVLLADVALLSQSRGSLYATPVMLVLVFALLPGRARTFAHARAGRARDRADRAGGAARGRRILDGGEVNGGGCTPPSLAMFLAALAVGLDRRARRRAREPSPPVSPSRPARGAAGLWRARAGDAARGARGRRLVAAGNPVTRIRHALGHLQEGTATRPTRSGNRLVSGLGSNRYDFYRVALDEFLAHPLVGIGADNFQQQYLHTGAAKRRRATRTASSCAR